MNSPLSGSSFVLRPVISDRNDREGWIEPSQVAWIAGHHNISALSGEKDDRSVNDVRCAGRAA